MIQRRLTRLWNQLQGRKPQMPHFLSEVHLAGIRGIEDLRIQFDYPVSVIAGGNASGKSTVLFAAACAYRVPGAGVRDYVPSTLFPDYRPKKGGKFTDPKPKISIQFEYSTLEGRLSMRWRRNAGWNRSFLGRHKARQPERPLYLRTLANLSNPSEVRSVLSMSRMSSTPQAAPLTPLQIDFAQRMLPFRYSNVVNLSSGGKKGLLFAERKGGPAYSELHMAAGERAVLRLARDIAQVKEALVLIDEVEAGLHPWVQQLLMIELQELALRNDLQVIVTSHSSVVLDSVPPFGRIFLDRDDDGRVTVRRPYRDVIQQALYGRSGESLNVLCEDEAAEGILNGIFDYLLPQKRMERESVRVGRDTGAGEFPTHAAAFRKFGRIEDFVFVLDGDQRDGGAGRKIKEQARRDVPVLYLPGDRGPEVWVWDRLRQTKDIAAAELGVAPGDLSNRMENLDSLYDSASGGLSEIAKFKLANFAEALKWSPSDICRTVTRREAERPESEIQPLATELESALLRWRGE